jgi:hypothetical protein
MANPPTDGDEEENQTVHKYLVFALLLPNHPFSEDMKQILRVVAPMYPSVVVVTGSAYEFRDMANKYIITSFPKLMFFQAGLFMGTFDELVRDPMTVAAQFSKWTKSLPQSFPINSIEYAGDPRKPASPTVHHSPRMVWNEIVLNSSAFLESLDHLISPFVDSNPFPSSMKMSVFSSFSSLTSLSLPHSAASFLPGVGALPTVISIPYFVPSPNIEPFLGSVELFGLWDARIFMLSAVYFILRAVFGVYRYVSKR